MQAPKRRKSTSKSAKKLAHYQNNMRSASGNTRNNTFELAAEKKQTKEPANAQPIIVSSMNSSFGQNMQLANSLNLKSILDANKRAESLEKDNQELRKQITDLQAQLHSQAQQNVSLKQQVARQQETIAQVRSSVHAK